MYSKELLEKYADVLIEKGVNIQKGQYLLLQCCIDTLPLARIICEKALLKGAKDVHVSISDPVIKKLRGKYLSQEQCSVVYDFEKEELKYYFPEFSPYEGKCRFNGCDHIHEPGCAVKEAVESGAIHKIRYEDYTEMYRELKEKKRY